MKALVGSRGRRVARSVNFDPVLARPLRGVERSIRAGDQAVHVVRAPREGRYADTHGHGHRRVVGSGRKSQAAMRRRSRSASAAAPSQ